MMDMQNTEEVIVTTADGEKSRITMSSAFDFPPHGAVTSLRQPQTHSL